MKKIMKLLAVIFTVGFLIFTFVYRIAERELFLSVTITFGTCTYHFLMRLIVGYGIDAVYHNQMDYHRKWFQPKQWESKFYKKLKVKSWKDKMPTYDADTFSLESHSMEEIVMAMCQSEIVHEIIVVLSFVPLLFYIWFESFAVFLITSLLAAGFDMMFVVMQRYNRPRIIKLLGAAYESKRNRIRSD